MTALAWAYLIHLDHQMPFAMEHDGMTAATGTTSHTPWSAADFLFTFVMWAVMMAGMMTPAAAPVLILFAVVRRGRAEPNASPATLIFGLGYLAVWTGFSGVAAFTQWMLHEAAMVSTRMAASSSYLAAAILIGVGIYELTPLKSRCLTHCRSPLAFLLANWKTGKLGAFQMGIRHGIYCLGCCWALMCVLFVVGAMNLVWIAALTVYVLIQRVGPAGALVTWGASTN